MRTYNGDNQAFHNSINGKSEKSNVSSLVKSRGVALIVLPVVKR